MAGTIPYMCPEQLRGKPVDKRADIWSFGCCLFEAVTGNRPFRGESVADVISAVLGKTRLLVWLRPVQDSKETSLRFETALPNEQHIALDRYAPLGEPRRSIAISPDGTQLAYLASDSGPSQMYLQRLDGFDPSLLAGTEGAYDLFFSPDSRWLAFFSQGKLKKISTSGGPPIELCEVAFPNGGTWADDGHIYVSDYFAEVLTKVPENGGSFSTEKSQWGGKAFQWISALPREKGLLASRRRDGLVHLDTNHKHPLIRSILPLEHNAHPCYVQSGHIIYASDGGR
jgi:serine/threonine protein kinase